MAVILTQKVQELHLEPELIGSLAQKCMKSKTASYIASVFPAPTFKPVTLKLLADDGDVIIALDTENLDDDEDVAI